MRHKALPQIRSATKACGTSFGNKVVRRWWPAGAPVPSLQRWWPAGALPPVLRTEGIALIGPWFVLPPVAEVIIPTPPERVQKTSAPTNLINFTSIQATDRETPPTSIVYSEVVVWRFFASTHANMLPLPYPRKDHNTDAALLRPTCALCLGPVSYGHETCWCCGSRAFGQFNRQRSLPAQFYRDSCTEEPGEDDLESERLLDLVYNYIAARDTVSVAGLCQGLGLDMEVADAVVEQLEVMGFMERKDSSSMVKLVDFDL